MSLSSADVAKLRIVEVPGGVELTLKVVPGASRTRIVGVLGNSLKVAVAAPAEGGKANAAVVELLAGLCGLRSADVTIVTGHSSPHKRISLAGLDVRETARRLTRAG